MSRSIFSAAVAASFLAAGMFGAAAPAMAQSAPSTAGAVDLQVQGAVTQIQGILNLFTSKLKSEADAKAEIAALLAGKTPEFQSAVLAEVYKIQGVGAGTIARNLVNQAAALAGVPTTSVGQGGSSVPNGGGASPTTVAGGTPEGAAEYVAPPSRGLDR